MSNDTAQAHVEKIIALAQDRRKHKSESDGNDPEQRGWPDPKPLPNGLAPVEAFDSKFLPDALGPWVEDVGNRLQCPPDYVAVAAITSLGAVRPSHRYQATEEDGLG